MCGKKSHNTLEVKYKKKRKKEGKGRVIPNWAALKVLIRRSEVAP